MNRHSVRRAILLLAGRGRRLGRLTEHSPKCMVEVAGMSILERALRTLSCCGVCETILVVGYRSESIQRYAGNHHSGMGVRYVINSRHTETNTAYSLWLARRFLDSDVLLLEGDIVFDSKTLRPVIDDHGGESVWAALPVTPGRDEGILLGCSEAGHVECVRLVREPKDMQPGLRYKCGGIQLLTAPLARALARRLDQAIAEGQEQIFADLVLGEVVRDYAVRICSLEGKRWAEVDDPDDLILARKIFGRPSERVAAGLG